MGVVIGVQSIVTADGHHPLITNVEDMTVRVQGHIHLVSIPLKINIITNFVKFVR